MRYPEYWDFRLSDQWSIYAAFQLRRLWRVRSFDRFFVFAACAKLIANTATISPANIPAVRHCDEVVTVQITIAIAQAPSTIAMIAKIRSIEIIVNLLCYDVSTRSLP